MIVYGFESHLWHHFTRLRRAPQELFLCLHVVSSKTAKASFLRTLTQSSQSNSKRYPRTITVCSTKDSIKLSKLSLTLLTLRYRQRSCKFIAMNGCHNMRAGHGHLGRAKAHQSIAKLSKAKLHKAMRASELLWGLGRCLAYGLVEGAWCFS